MKLIKTEKGYTTGWTEENRNVFRSTVLLSAFSFCSSDYFDEMETTEMIMHYFNNGRESAEPYGTKHGAVSYMMKVLPLTTQFIEEYGLANPKTKEYFDEYQADLKLKLNKLVGGCEATSLQRGHVEHLNEIIESLEMNNVKQLKKLDKLINNCRIKINDCELCIKLEIEKEFGKTIIILPTSCAKLNQKEQFMKHYNKDLRQILAEDSKEDFDLEKLSKVVDLLSSNDITNLDKHFDKQ
jgi:hypothetical protein